MSAKKRDAIDDAFAEADGAVTAADRAGDREALAVALRLRADVWRQWAATLEPDTIAWTAALLGALRDDTEAGRCGGAL